MVERSNYNNMIFMFARHPPTQTPATHNSMDKRAHGTNSFHNLSNDRAQFFGPLMNFLRALGILAL